MQKSTNNTNGLFSIRVFHFEYLFEMKNLYKSKDCNVLTCHWLTCSFWKTPFIPLIGPNGILFDFSNNLIHSDKLFSRNLQVFQFDTPPLSHMKFLRLYLFDKIDINASRFATRSRLLLNSSFVANSGMLMI